MSIFCEKVVGFENGIRLEKRIPEVELDPSLDDKQPKSTGHPGTCQGRTQLYYRWR